jgi:RNA-directed DNA polymerase
LDRKTLKRFRALLFQIEKDGCNGKHWGNTDNVLSSIKGFANYVAMVNPEKGRHLLLQVNRILKKERYRPEHKLPGNLSPKHFRSAAEDAKAPHENWWQPLPRPEPQPPKLKELEKPQPVAETRARRSTRDIVDNALRDNRQNVSMPHHGIWRRFFVQSKNIFWWALITYVTIHLAKASITLAVIFFVIAALFRIGLRG